ncbi:MAG: FAD-binding protein [Oscillospiraceae bacterium]|jgi:L-aspartate oxidase|nr:FAD-binding protein [Oscillospiraceae bacterium]
MQYDVIILGSGLAGLYAALHLGQCAPAPRVLILSKQSPTDSGSALAQGGVAAVLEEDDDSFVLHAEDTLIAGNYINDKAAVDALVTEGPQDVRHVMDLGVEFDRNAQGELNKTLEGGHSRRRIVHHKDQTGKEMVDKLLPHVLALPNVTLLEDATACFAVRTKNGFAIDAICGDGAQRFFCRALLLATGGIGRVYRYTTNPAVSTGDGIRLAYELGAKTKRLHFIQFHPTAFAAQNDEDPFLISEAIRGEGAYLLNCYHRRFMQNYDQRLELAPRDVVSRSILMESRRVGSRHFYLDIRHRGAAFLQKRFPAIDAACKVRGIDIASDFIPVFPCQHYLMGGVDVDLCGRTCVPGLYAAGECAHTGLHGGNRLASNSLPEALVFSRHAANDILSYLQKTPQSGCDAVALPYRSAAQEISTALKDEIRATMQHAFFVFPEVAALPSGASRMREIYETLRTGDYAVTRDYAETLSLACVAALILEELLS